MRLPYKNVIYSIKHVSVTHYILDHLHIDPKAKCILSFIYCVETRKVNLEHKVKLEILFFHFQVTCNGPVRVC